LGGSNSSYFKGELNYNKLTEQTFWQIGMKSVKVENDLTLCSGGCETIVDTGAILINGPKSEIEKLNAHLGFDSTDGSIDCEMRGKMSSKGLFSNKKHFFFNQNNLIVLLKAVDFTLGPKIYHLSPYDYVIVVGFV
jgi:hypothetical protein